MESDIHPGLHGPEVTSPKSRRLREAAKLDRKQGRAKSGRFLVEGPQGIREALRHQAENRPKAVTLHVEPGQAAPRGTGAVLDVWATVEAAERNPDIIEAARKAGIKIKQTAPEALASVAETVNSQGMIAVVEQLHADLTSVVTKEAKLLVVLSQVRDPGNAGTVLRAADAAGADGVIITSSSVDVYNPKAVRSTAGSIFHLPVVTGVGLPEVTELARARGLQILAADGHPPAHDLHVPWDTGLDLARPTAWVFGNEAWGLPEADRAQADAAVAIPIYGKAESLNLATAASIAVYESAKHVRMI